MVQRSSPSHQWDLGTCLVESSKLVPCHSPPPLPRWVIQRFMWERLLSNHARKERWLKWPVFKLRVASFINRSAAAPLGLQSRASIWDTVLIREHIYLHRFLLLAFLKLPLVLEAMKAADTLPSSLLGFAGMKLMCLFARASNGLSPRGHNTLLLWHISWSHASSIRSRVSNNNHMLLLESLTALARFSASKTIPPPTNYLWVLLAIMLFHPCSIKGLSAVLDRSSCFHQHLLAQGPGRAYFACYWHKTLLQGFKSNFTHACDSLSVF